jgi:hypothetical protein
MARIRLLVPVAGHLADGIPAPAVLEPVEVPDAVADSWCDGVRAELAPEDSDATAVHADAREYLTAVEAQHAEALAAVHADAREYLAAVEAQHAEALAAVQAQLAASNKPASKTKS